MRPLWAPCLCLSLGCLCAAARAEEVGWHPAGQLPAVGWHAVRPALPEPGLVDPSVRQAAFVLPTAAQRPAMLPETAEPPAAAPANAAPEDRPLPQPPAFPGAPAAPEDAPAGDADCNPVCWVEPLPPTCLLDVRGGYLLWWTRASWLPPLVTTAPASSPGRGTLGESGTTVLFGDQAADGQARSGGRLLATLWVDPGQTLGLEAGGFLLEQAATDFAAASGQFPVLARPVFLVNQGSEGRQLLATPGTLPGEALRLRGQVSADAPSRLWGAEAGLCGNLGEDAHLRLDFVGGFRFLGLDEGLHVTTDTLSLRGVPGVSALDPGNELAVSDRFDAHNHFYGGHAGLRGEWRLGRWAVEGQARVALGVNDETVDVAGSRTFTTADGAQQQAGGLLALPSNSGRFSQVRFAVAPEAGVKLSYGLTDGLRVFVGYDVLYWSNVVRPADQVDRGIDSRLAGLSAPPGGAGQGRPTFAFHETGYWAQGVTAGLEVRY